MTALWDIGYTASIIRTMIALMLEAVRTPETLVYFNETKGHYILEGCRLILSAFKA
jgi:hypothetical protein